MELLGVVLLILLAIVALFQINRWLKLPNRCPSCNARFDEAKMPIFCRIGDKEVRFCATCVNRPVGRLGTNNVAFAAKGFSAAELCRLQDYIDLYKRRS